MKETKELLLALALLGKLVASRLKDGVQLDDAIAVGTALLTDPKLKASLEAAMKDFDKIDDEFKDFNLAKGLELLQVLPEMIAALELGKK